MTPYRSGQRDGFPQLLHAEWTKFRTVRGWVIGMVAAALMMVLFALFAGVSSVQHGRHAVPIGPGGEPVTDSFYFVHRPLAGNGSITVSVSSLKDGGFTVTGAGDIAPAVRETLPSGGAIRDLLTGTFAALIAVIVVGTRFITAEYRENLICVTLAACPRRGRVLAAKAIVLGAVTFVAGLAGAVAAVPLGEWLARANGVYLFPVTSPALLRVEFGTAALLAAASILALAIGTVVRRGAGAVTTVITAIVLPYIVVAIPFVPVGVSDWLTRVTPTAAFAVQQTLVSYHQVTSIYTPYDDYYPLAPWSGFAVLAGYAVVSLAVAAVLLHRRDA